MFLSIPMLRWTSNLTPDVLLPTKWRARKSMTRCKTLACQGPIAFLANGDLFTAMRANVKDFQPLSTRSLVYLRQTTLEK